MTKRSLLFGLTVFLAFVSFSCVSCEGVEQGSATVCVVNSSGFKVTDIQLLCGTGLDIPPFVLEKNEKRTFEMTWNGASGANQNIEYKINGVLFDIEAEEAHRIDEYGVHSSDKALVDGSKAVITIYADKYTIVVD